MKMTIGEAIDYAVKGNGMDYSDELFNKVDSYLKKLPHKPTNARYLGVNANEITVTDYHEGWFAIIHYGKSKCGKKFLIEVIDGDNLDENPNRVKSNKEALNLMEEYHNLKNPTSHDEYWLMSDDHRYSRRMGDLQDKYLMKKNDILARL